MELTTKCNGCGEELPISLINERKFCEDCDYLYEKAVEERKGEEK